MSCPWYGLAPFEAIAELRLTMVPGATSTHAASVSLRAAHRSRSGSLTSRRWYSGMLRWSISRA